MVPRKILVVDDSPTMLRILVNTLNKAGYESVETASDGKDGLQKLLGDPQINLVLTDWNMPEMSGIEFLQAIKANDKTKSIPVMLVTSRNVKEDILLAIKSGAKDYVVKPFTVEAIKDKISGIA